MGFAEHEDGAWTWTCVQRELRRPVEAPSGSALHLATIFGLPFVRLRAALPEAMFAGSVGRALGRKAGLSVSGLTEAADDNIAAMQKLASAMSCFAPPATKIPEFDAESDAALPKTPGAPPSPAASGRMQRSIAKRSRSRSTVASPAASVSSLSAPEPPASWKSREVAEAEAEDRASELVGTALVFAFMSNAKTLPVQELKHRVAQASERLAGVRVPGIDHGFDALYAMFIVMLSAGNLSGRSDWLEKSRMWRLILLQRADGGFDLTESLAFALQAHEGAVPPRPKPESKLRQLIAAFLEEDDFDEVIDEAMSDDDSVDIKDDDPEEEKRRQQLGGHANDCPLSFSGRAVRHRLPKALAQVNDGRKARVAAAIAAAEEERLRQAKQRAAAEAALRAQAAAREDRVALAIAQSVEAQQAALLQTPLMAMLKQLARDSMAGSLPASYRSGLVSPPLSRSPPRSPSPQRALSPAGAPSAAAGVRLPSLLPVDRVWATILAMEVLKEFGSSWLLDDDAPTPWRTVVDGCAEYLRSQAKQDRRLRKLLKSGDLELAADKARKDWMRIQAANVLAVRDADVINRFTAITHMQRASARVVRSVMTDHGTFAAFLDTDGYIMRWQRLSACPF
jgi:hypothetical protein